MPASPRRSPSSSRSRFERIPEGRRPYFTPAQRFRILEIKSLLGWSARDIAREFLLCTNTILNWQIAADPASRTVGVRVTPVPPVRKAADVVVAVAQLMAKMGFGGIDLSSRILARAGWRLSARSIGRFRREKPQPPVAPAPAPAARPPRPVKARFVHHVWMMDVTEVKQFLGPSLHLAAVFDAFSRVPLALRVFEGEMPTARDMGQLLRAAVRAFTRPRHVVTDLGTEFTGKAFASAVKHLGASQRFAAKDSIKATARLERFWRTIKETARLRRLHRPLTASDLEVRLEVALLYYICFRPHEGLDGAIPVEVFLGLEPAHLMAIEPPRAGPGNHAALAPPFEARFLDPVNRRFPILQRAA